MTEEGNAYLSYFLRLVSDYLNNGHARFREDKKPVEEPKVKDPMLAELPAQESPAEKPEIPLAYRIKEPGENEEENDSSATIAPAKHPLEAVAADVTACKACGLAATRTNAVPGEGNIQPLVMVIGEGPGADEDRQGRPFVGKAGQLLDKMLASIGLFRDKNCFIANMVKCRPPGNRDPGPEEIAACSPYLERQILLLRPRLILCVGRVAAQNLLNTSKGINALRGEFAELTIGDTVIPVLPTFHPSALLRDESLKRPAWEDLKLLRSKLDSLNGG